MDILRFLIPFRNCSLHQGIGFICLQPCDMGMAFFVQFHFPGVYQVHGPATVFIIPDRFLLIQRKDCTRHGLFLLVLFPDFQFRLIAFVDEGLLRFIIAPLPVRQFKYTDFVG